MDPRVPHSDEGRLTVARRGFVLGKFLPPHTGHEYLCEFASAHCDELTILVCSIERESIPGPLRHAWMAERFPHARVLHCAEEVPQTPEEHPDFWPIWTDLVRRYHPEPIDQVFASEDYGVELAHVLGARFVPVDPARTVQPVSGTDVRRSPWKKWDYIASPARGWFTRSVCLHGPESTGKSTLAGQLAAHYQTCIVPEFGRTYTEYFGTECTAGDIAAIARGQTAAISASRRFARGLLVSDTDAVLSAVWSDMLAGRRDPWFEGVFPTCDLYLLTDVDVPWVDDGTRYFNSTPERVQFFELCEAELKARALPYVRLSGSWDDRFDQAIQAIETQFSDLIGTDRSAQ